MAKAGFDTMAGFNAIPCGYQKITALNAVKGLTAPTTKGPVHAALLRTEGQSVRWRDDGTDPDATNGTLVQPTDPPFEYTGDLSAIKFFEVAASATLHVHYYQIAR